MSVKRTEDTGKKDSLGRTIKKSPDSEGARAHAGDSPTDARSDFTHANQDSSDSLGDVEQALSELEDIEETYAERRRDLEGQMNKLQLQIEALRNETDQQQFAAYEEMVDSFMESVTPDIQGNMMDVDTHAQFLALFSKEWAYAGAYNSGESAKIRGLRQRVYDDLTEGNEVIYYSTDSAMNPPRLAVSPRMTDEEIDAHADQAHELIQVYMAARQKVYRDLSDKDTYIGSVGGRYGITARIRSSGDEYVLSEYTSQGIEKSPGEPMDMRGLLKQIRAMEQQELAEEDAENASAEREKNPRRSWLRR